jgi:hypothetical protein
MKKNVIFVGWNSLKYIFMKKNVEFESVWTMPT